MVKVQSDGENKKIVKKQRIRRRKKEERRTESGKNPIYNYFPKVDVNVSQTGKRKCESTNLENTESSKKFRVGSSDYRTGETSFGTGSK